MTSTDRIMITINATDLLDDCGDYCLCQRARVADLFVAQIRKRLYLLVAGAWIDVQRHWQGDDREGRPWGIYITAPTERIRVGLTIAADIAQGEAWDDESWWPEPANETGQHELGCSWKDEA